MVVHASLLNTPRQAFFEIESAREAFLCHL